jgi:hypothetical protein
VIFQKCSLPLAINNPRQSGFDVGCESSKMAGMNQEKNKKTEKKPGKL